MDVMLACDTEDSMGSRGYPAEFRRRVLHLAAKGAVSGTTGAANRSAAMPRRRPMSARAIRGGSTSRATERIIWVRPARVGGHPSRAE
jgi:hypothetical protein